MDVHPCPGGQGGHKQQQSHKPGDYTVGHPRSIPLLSKQQNRIIKVKLGYTLTNNKHINK